MVLIKHDVLKNNVNIYIWLYFKNRGVARISNHSYAEVAG